MVTIESDLRSSLIIFLVQKDSHSLRSGKNVDQVLSPLLVDRHSQRANPVVPGGQDCWAIVPCGVQDQDKPRIVLGGHFDTRGDSVPL